MTLDKNGFKRKSYDELLEENQTKAREMFGANINVSKTGVAGIFSRIFAWFLAKLYDDMEKVYQSAFISTAEGVQMDRLASNRGLSRNRATESYATISIKGVPGYVVDVGTEFSTATNLYFMVFDPITIDSKGVGVGEVVSVEKGTKYNVLANTITIQAEPVEEITSVTNAVASAGGQDVETDLSLANRIRLGGESGKGTLNGIISSLSAVNGVIATLVIENNTNALDEDGNAPKSIHAYSLGGTSSDIATALFQSIPAGISTNGSKSFDVTDVSGTPHTIKFDYAEQKEVFVKVTIKRTTSFGDGGVEEVKENIVSLVGGTYNGNVYNPQGLGQNVILSRLYRGVTVGGIDDINILIGLSADSVAEENIVIKSKEVATISPENIEVIIA